MLVQSRMSNSKTRKIQNGNDNIVGTIVVILLIQPQLLKISISIQIEVINIDS